jgi:uncharacterized protein
LCAHPELEDPNVTAGPLANLVDPAILFFFLGIFVAMVRSNLEIPPQIVKFCSLYLLMAIGFKGGQALAASGLDAELAKVLAIAVVLALLLPGVTFLILRRRVDHFDAAAIAATYGSVSAVTFIAASSFLTRQGLEFSGAMTVALVVMESPAIIMAVFLAAWVRSRQPAATVMPQPVGAAVAEAVPLATAGTGPASVGLRAILHEAFTDGAHLLLIGSMLIGALSTAEGAAAMEPFTQGLFKGVLAFFLLEMGLLVAREMRNVGSIGGFLVSFGLVMPVASATTALGAAYVLGVAEGNAVLLAVLAASASYIVVPAVVRYAIPEARPSRYFGLALGVTFPFNIVVGIPLYSAMASRLF